MASKPAVLNIGYISEIGPIAAVSKIANPSGPSLLSFRLYWGSVVRILLPTPFALIPAAGMIGQKLHIDLNAITVPKGCTNHLYQYPIPCPHRLEIVMYVSLPKTVVATWLDKALRWLKREDFPMSWLSISLTAHTVLRQFYCGPFFACIALFDPFCVYIGMFSFHQSRFFWPSPCSFPFHDASYSKVFLSLSGSGWDSTTWNKEQEVKMVSH